MSVRAITQEDRQTFTDLLNKIGNIKKGTIMSGVVIMEDNYYVFVDLGLKAYGKINKEEFYASGKEELPQQGEVIPVLLEALEDINGDLVISYSKAQRQSKWAQLEQYYQKRTQLEASFVKKCNGGCIVRILEVSAFLPKTHFPNDIKDAKDLMKKKLNCIIIRMDLNKSNIVVSARNSNDIELLANFSVGQITQGVVKSIFESYALVELGSGIVGKLHIKELSWGKVENINDILSLDQNIQLKIISISEGSRIELSLREVEGNNPWLEKLVTLNFAKDQVVTGKITKIEERLLFVELHEEVIGTLHISEVSWNKKYQNFNSFKENEMLTAKVIEINGRNNRLLLSIKKMDENSLDQFPVGTKIQGTIIGLSEIGYIVNIKDRLDGVIPNSSYYMDGTLNNGQTIDAYVHSNDNYQLTLGLKSPK